MAGRMVAGSSRRRFVGGIAVALVASGGALWVVRSRTHDDEPGVYVHAGPRTTWITGPLRPDGTVDYVAYTREVMKRGVTPENDLAPVMSLCLERPLHRVDPASDLPRPPAPLVSWWTWAEAHSLDQDSTKEASDPVADLVGDAECAWLAGRADGPLAAELKRWLAEIGPALDLLQREARTRDHWFVPPAANELDRAELITSLKTIVPSCCERALARSAAGDATGAAEDFVTAFDLVGRWRGCNGLIGLLSVLACEGFMTESLETLARTSHEWKCADFRRVDAAASHTLRDDQLADMLPWERVAQLDRTIEIILDPAVFERAAKFSEHLQQTMRNVASEGGGTPGTGVTVDDLHGNGTHCSAITAREMDRLLEALNDRFDTLFATLLPPMAWDARIAEVGRLRAEFQGAAHEKMPFFWDFWREHTFAETTARSPESVADLIVSLEAPLLGSSLETITVTTVAADAARLRLAIACFKNEHGRNPADDAELVAACFDAPPRDRLYGEPLRWTVGADGRIDVTSRGAPLADRLKAQHAKPR